MPAVNPATAGMGMYLIIAPMRAKPRPISMSPASAVQITRLSAPCSCATAATTGMKAAVGPPIATFEPPRAETRKPATMPVTMPTAGVAPDAMPNAMLSDRAMIPSVTPADTSARRSERE